MRIPVPNNRLVAFTLAGGLLTMLVATGLAFPGLVGLTESASEAAGTDTDATQQVAADGPEPNQNFTPAVEEQSGYEEEYDEHEEDDDEDEEHGDEDDEEHEEEEYDDDEYGEH